MKTRNVKKDTAYFYDEFWRRQLDSRESLFKIWWSEAYVRLNEIVGPCAGKCMLILGAGAGDEAIAYAQSGANVVAFDLAESSVSLCMRKSAEKNLRNSMTAVLGDAESMPFIPGAFDVVLVMNMIMHTDADRVVAECRRVLKSGGTWALIEPMRYPHIAMLARYLEPYRWKTFVRYTRLSDVIRWSKQSRWSEHREYFFLSTLVVMLLRLSSQSGFLRAMLGFACRADRWILSRFAFLRPLSYLIVAGFRP